LIAGERRKLLTNLLGKFERKRQSWRPKGKWGGIEIKKKSLKMGFKGVKWLPLTQEMPKCGTLSTRLCVFSIHEFKEFRI
jgi:hypothetical protein